MVSEVEELFSFLEDTREDVRQLATQHVASLSTSAEMLPHFVENDYQVVRTLIKLRNDVTSVAHDAMKALINLSAHADMRQIMNDDAFIFGLVLTIIVPNSILSDLCCMLLNNLSKNVDIAKKLIPEVEGASKESASIEHATQEKTFKESNSSENSTAQLKNSKKMKTQYLDNLLEVFVRGDSKKYNPNANFHFLSGVFANVSITLQGANFLLGHSTVDGQLRLARLVPYTEHPDLIRRGGVVSAIKNCCFYHEKHQEMLSHPQLNMLPYLLLPLCGPEEFTEEEMEEMPHELQFLDNGKQREQDPKLRLILVETLLMLTCTLFGRNYLRTKKTYAVVQKLHLCENDEHVRSQIERLVDMLARDEEAEKVSITENNEDLSSTENYKTGIQQVIDFDS